MNTETPPPRLVPDRPSDAAIAQAFWENHDAWPAFKFHANECIIQRAAQIDGAIAAPPAEEPAVNHGMSCADMEVAYDCSQQVIADQKARIELLESLLFDEQNKSRIAVDTLTSRWRTEATEIRLGGLSITSGAICRMANELEEAISTGAAPAAPAVVYDDDEASDPTALQIKYAEGYADGVRDGERLSDTAAPAEGDNPTNGTKSY